MPRHLLLVVLLFGAFVAMSGAEARADGLFPWDVVEQKKPKPTPKPTPEKDPPRPTPPAGPRDGGDNE